LNSPGTVDSDYRGELSVILVNLGQAPFVIRRGERIAQLIIAPVARARLEVVAAVSETARGSGGFGSTGVGPPKPQHTAHSKKAAQKKKAVPSKNPAGERRARKVAAMRSRSSH
jgi:dUTP pyrophosphatase